MTVVGQSRPTLSDQVFARTAEAIVRGQYPPGAAISEADVAERLGVSRAPAREAIYRLEAKGLVTRAPHLGARVVQLTLDSMRELFQMREALEGMACRLAAAGMSDAELAELDRSLDGHHAQPDVAAGASYYQPDGDEDFHFRIARGSGNGRLVRALCDDLYYVLRTFRFQSSTLPGRARQALNEHRSIVAALKARSGDAAECLMREHIRRSWSNVEGAARASSTSGG
jgi:DNA-binding GntR family transcriptional regulator